ncbi:MAG: MBL fold metallo-hydrolase [Desulfohalobiaceae bacterium]
MLNVQDFPLGPLQTNCFVVYNQNEALVVDPGGEPDPVLDFIRRKNLNLVFILNTHFHFDHILGNRSLQKAIQVPILASPKDDSLLQAQVGGGGGMMGFPTVEAFEYQALEPGSYTWLGEECQVLATPGHTPGSLSFYFPQSSMVFSGDLIFSRSVGRTDFPGGSTEALLQSVKEKIFILPEKTVIYAGHGPQTTVHEEKLFNPFFQEGFFL